MENAGALTTGSPSSNYVYYATSSTVPTSSTALSGNTASIGLVNLTNLTAGTTYYFWILSNCGNSVSTWHFF